MGYKATLLALTLLALAARQPGRVDMRALICRETREEARPRGEITNDAQSLS